MDNGIRKPSDEETKVVLGIAKKFHADINLFMKAEKIPPHIMASAVMVVATSYAAESDASISKMVEHFRTNLLRTRKRQQLYNQPPEGTA